jgi:predicted hotdog family 3-hydroxylacyl-ACP dehydratase
MSFPPVAELIPQRPPMLLLDAVLAAGDGAITCAAEVRPDNLFLRDGRAPAATVLEYMAQAIAAERGLEARDRPPAVGLIAACRTLELHADHLAAGDRLVITAERGYVGELAEYTARVTRDGRPLAEAVLHVVTAPLHGPSAPEPPHGPSAPEPPHGPSAPHGPSGPDLAREGA